MNQTLSPLQAQIQALALNPDSNIQYAIVQGYYNFNSLASIYRAGLICNKLGIRSLHENNRLLAQHYGRLATCFFRMFELLTSS